MASGKSSSVTLRQDLAEMVEEIAFADLALAGDSIAPTVSVPTPTGRYPVMPRENHMKVPNTIRQSDGSYPRGQWNWEDDSYITREYGFEQPIDNVKALEEKQFVNHETVAATLAREGLLLGRESRIASALFNTTTWTGATNTTALTNEWDDATNCTPWADIDTAAKVIREKCGMAKSNLTLVLSDDLVDYVIRSNEIKGAYQYTDFGAVLRSNIEGKAQFLASYFNIDRVIITKAMYDTTKLASSATIGKFWSNEYAFLGYMPSSATIYTQCAIKQLVWSEYSTNFIMEDYEVPERNQMIIRAREYRGTKVLTEYGLLFTNMKTTVSATTGI